VGPGGPVRRALVAGWAERLRSVDAARLDTAIVQQRLAERFYPFAAIDWLELPAALAASRATGKPMHVVLLFGSLLDESC